MRKHIIDQSQPIEGLIEPAWLNLEELALVEVSSEAPDYPVEFALLPKHRVGWQAGRSGMQCLRLIFDQPQQLNIIRLSFSEPLLARCQEYCLRWSADIEHPLQEFIRQQWNFSPTGSTVEREEHLITLAHVKVLELQIIPDIQGGGARATLERLQLA